MPDITVLKALVLAGCGSRRAMAEAIKQGRVTLGDEVVQSFTQRLEESYDLKLDGKPVRQAKEGYVYLMLNKPTGVLSTTRDERGRCTVMDLLPPEFRNLPLHLIGRLDADSSGLVILTDDGALTQALTHPSFEKEKEYLVSLDRELNSRDEAVFENGIELADGLTAPASVRGGNKPAYYYVILHEGRKRQIRRMFAQLGYQVLALKRIRIGSLLLGDLPKGKMRPLADTEVASLRSR